MIHIRNMSITIRYLSRFGAVDENILYAYHQYFLINNNFLGEKIKADNCKPFLELLDQYFDQENILKFLEQEKCNTPLDSFKTAILHYFFNTYSYIFLNPENTDILKIFIAEYNYQPNEYIMEQITYHEKFIYLLKILHQFMDIRKYIKNIATGFTDACSYRTLEYIKQYQELGFEVPELLAAYNERGYNAYMAAIENGDTAVLKYLLDNSPDFHAHEKNLLAMCIRHSHNKHLKLLIEYGADLKIFCNDKTDNLNSAQKEIITLLQENNIDFKIIYQLLKDLYLQDS